jgi:hypothetical protein
MLSARPPRIGTAATRAPAGAAALDAFAGLAFALAFAFAFAAGFFEAGFDGFDDFDDLAVAVDFDRVDFALGFVDFVACLAGVACFSGCLSGFAASGLAFGASGFAASGFASGGIGSATFAGGSATSRGDRIGCADAAAVVASTPATSEITSLGHLMKRTISGVRLPRWIWRSARR